MLILCSVVIPGNGQGSSEKSPKALHSVDSKNYAVRIIPHLKISIKNFHLLSFFLFSLIEKVFSNHSLPYAFNSAVLCTNGTFAYACSY